MTDNFATYFKYSFKHNVKLSVSCNMILWSLRIYATGRISDWQFGKKFKIGCSPQYKLSINFSKVHRFDSNWHSCLPTHAIRSRKNDFVTRLRSPLLEAVYFPFATILFCFSVLTFSLSSHLFLFINTRETIIKFNEKNEKFNMCKKQFLKNQKLKKGFSLFCTKF